VAVSPKEGSRTLGVVYAGTNPSSVFRSEDGGESWRELFTRSICLTIEPLLAEINVHGPIAVVTCREKMSSVTLDSSTVATTMATNIFEKQRGRWLLIHRHASPVLEPGAAAAGS